MRVAWDNFQTMGLTSKIDRQKQTDSNSRIGLAVSKYPHFNSTYLVKVRLSLDLAVDLQTSSSNNQSIDTFYNDFLTV